MPRRLGQTVCALVLAAGAVTGCGADDSPEANALASIAPPDAPLFVEATIRPDGEQAAAVESFAERAGGISDPGAAIAAQLDASFASEDLDVAYEDDIAPWLGDRGALFVSSFEPSGPTEEPDLALMVEVDDADAARSFLQDVLDQDPAPDEQREYQGVEYASDGDGHAAGVIDDTALVAGTENAFEVAVDASQGESLAESSEYTERVEALPDDSLAAAFFAPAATIEAVLASDGVDPLTAKMWAPLLDELLSEQIAVALTATPDAAVVDLAATAGPNALSTADPALIADLPADSWLAVAVPDLGEALEHGLDQLTASGLPGAHEFESRFREMTGLELGEDVLGWLGDAAGFVAGTTEATISLGLIAQSTDRDAPNALVAVLQRLAGVEAAVVGDSFVAVRGTTVDEALDPSVRLGDDPEYQAAVAALGDDFPAGLYLELPSFFDVAEQGSDGDVDYDALRPYLAAFAAVVAGSRVDGDLILSRFAVSLAPG